MPSPWLVDKVEALALASKSLQGFEPGSAPKGFTGRIFVEGSYGDRVCKCPGVEADTRGIFAETGELLVHRDVVDFGRWELAQTFRVYSKK